MPAAGRNCDVCEFSSVDLVLSAKMPLLLLLLLLQQ
jgi:hypothetical protein